MVSPLEMHDFPRNLVYILCVPHSLAQLVKNLPAMRRPGFDPWAGKIPWRREWLPTPVFLPGEFHRLGCLVSYGLQPMGLESQT